MAGNKRQTNPGGDERNRPVIAVRLIHDTYFYAAAGQHVRYVLDERALCPHDERLTLEIGECHGLPASETVVLSHCQHIGHCEKNLARESERLAVENRQHRIELLLRKTLEQLLACAIDHLDRYMGFGAAE